MANTTIPNLPSATSLTGSEQLEIVQNGVSVKTTTNAVAGLNTAAGTVTQINTNSPITGGPITTTGSIGLATAGVTNAYLADMAANTIKGNNFANSHAPVDLTVAQTMTLLGAAPLDSPLFTGNPRAPTPVSSDNSIAIATTAFVKAQSYGTGTVTSITAGTGLSGGTITSTGTISIASTGVTAGTYGSASTVPAIAINSQGQITSATDTPIQIVPGQVTGLGTMATQNANSVAITGGTINGTTIGGSTPAAATFTTLTATSNANFSTIASGTWSGSTIGIGYGGTGATTASGARSNLGAAASGANSDITSLTGLTTPLSAPQGGTGFSSFTTGDILYADTSSTLARLNDIATGNALISGGVGVAPSWGKIGLTTHVSGTLPVSSGGTGATTLTGFIKGSGTSAFTAQATIGNADLTNSSITIGSTAISLGGSTSTLAGLTTVTVTQDPTSALQLSTKQYVDGQVAVVSNQTFHTQSSYATTADLGTVNYSNGTGGVGATITNAGTQAALTIDGYTFTASDVTNATRVLVKNQSSGLQNGIYVVTNEGSISTNWQLTRASDFNTVGTGPNYIQTGAANFITSGTANGSTSWVMTTTGTIIVGTTALTWAQSSASGNILVTSPLSKTGNTISLGTVGVANGGTGLTSYTAYGLLYAPTTATVGQIGTGTSGYPLLSGGSGAAPSFSQLSLSGSGISGTLGVANGGTGTSTAFTTGSIVFAGASGVYSQNNSKFFWDNTNIRLGINTASPNTNLTVVSNTQTATPVSAGSLPAGTDLYILGADAANTRITQDAYGTGNYPAYTGRQARGTAASPTASQTGDILAQYTGRGYGATAFSTASVARIDMEAAENFTDTAQGSYISMHTTALGATSPTEKFRVGSAGQWGIGGATYGTSGYAFVSGGASAAPSWSQISLTAGVTGTLPATNGGTGLASYTTGDLLYASSSTALARLADVATGNVLLSGGVGVAPSWGQVSLTTAVTGTLPVTNGGTGQASALTQYGVVYGSTTSAMATTAAGTTGQILVATTGAAPSWSSSIPSTAGVTSFSAGTTGLTPSTGTTGAITLAGTLATGNGGTGLTGFTAANNAIYSTSSTALTAGTLPIAAGGTGITSFGTGVQTALGQSVTGSGGIVLATSPTIATPTITTSATVPLVIGGTTASSTLTLQSTSGVGTSDAISFKVGNNGATTAMTINTSGNVGIGTTSPSRKLEVGSLGAFRLQTGSVTMDCTPTAGATDSFVWNTSVNSIYNWQMAGTSRLYIDNSGNVGIGTTSPSRKLVVSNAGAAGYEIGPGGGLSSGNEFLNYNRSTSLYVQQTSYASYYAFYTGTAGSTRAMDIDSSGNVGIGTSSPGYKLDVSGTSNHAGTANFPGTSSTVAAVLANAAETTTVSATAATGTINYDVTTQSVLYYTSNATANWTLNIRGSSGTSLNTLMATGQTVTVAFMVTQGATAYYASALTIDGVSVTPKYQGGSAWTAGNASSIDVYVYTITKTASATYTVFASQTQFK